MDAKSITSALELPGFQIVENIGIVRGIVVRSRSIVGAFFAKFQTMLGGNITIYTSMCERARTDAFQLMVDQADRHGANAVIAVRYDATEVMSGVTEVLCYGTAVIVTRQAGATAERTKTDSPRDEPRDVRPAFGQRSDGPAGTLRDDRQRNSTLLRDTMGRRDILGRNGPSGDAK
jgi:uncharacterized protein YbjQ (UPF0145 family)